MQVYYAYITHKQQKVKDSLSFLDYPFCYMYDKSEVVVHLSYKVNSYYVEVQNH